jgi:hypothetical protein
MATRAVPFYSPTIRSGSDLSHRYGLRSHGREGLSEREGHGNLLVNVALQVCSLKDLLRGEGR